MVNTPSVSGVLRYPYEAITEKTDYLQLTIKKYVEGGLIEDSKFGINKNSFDVSNTAASSLKKVQLSENGVIILPMPSNIEDSNSVSYDGDTLNGLTAFGIAGYQHLTSADYGALFQKGTNRMDWIESLIGKITKSGQEVGVTADSVYDYISKYLTSSAVNIFGSNVTPNQLYARTSGKILNPNMELLFNNVTLRTFRFSFKMTPRDENESLQIKAIIRSFKRNMAARVNTGDNLFLETPNIFELQYKKGNLAHPFLHKFKQCALSDMSVNYTGENVYATYNDGTPISVIMTLTFKELVPIYQSDYPDNENLTYSSTGNTFGVGY